MNTHKTHSDQSTTPLRTGSRLRHHQTSTGALAWAVTALLLLSVTVMPGTAPTGSTPVHAFSPAQTTQQDEQDEMAQPCLGADDPDYQLGQLVDILSADTIISDVVRVGEDLFVSPVGKGELISEAPVEVEDGAPDSEEEVDPEEPPTEEVSFNRTQWRVFNTRTQLEYEVVMTGDMLKTILDCHQREGLTSATEGVVSLDNVENPFQVYLPFVQRGNDTSPSQATRAPALASTDEVGTSGWSNGVDTRIIRSPTTLWPWRTISHFSYGSQDSGCTGTLIGPRHLVTAAHCINKQGTNQWYNFTVTPAKNGSGSAPYGTSFVSTSPAPGTEVWYFTPSPWRNPSTSNPRQWDWGLIVIPNRLGNQTGWMGYVARPGSQLKQVNNYNRGYPQCNNDKPNKPAGCQIARLYGDTQNCTPGGFYYKGGDGWNRLISVSCDMSAGHSGSAVYHYFFDQQLGRWVPVVSMVAVSESCFTCSASDTYPNYSRRITPGDLGVISWLREVFP